MSLRTISGTTVGDCGYLLDVFHRVCRPQHVRPSRGHRKLTVVLIAEDGTPVSARVRYERRIYIYAFGYLFIIIIVKTIYSAHYI